MAACAAVGVFGIALSIGDVAFSPSPLEGEGQGVRGTNKGARHH